MAFTITKVVLALMVMAFLIPQCRKPAWLPGRLILSIMNASHSAVTKWGLGHVSIGKSFTILDIGCGGGKNIQNLAAIASEGKVYGVDYSATSVDAARSTNAGAKVEIQQASVSKLPFAESMFDLVTAVETHYYWPDLVSDLREVLRVLKPGGALVIIAETYRGEKLDKLLALPMRLIGARYLTIDEHRQMLLDAGFVEVNVDVNSAHGWICAVGRKNARA